MVNIVLNIFGVHTDPKVLSVGHGNDSLAGLKEIIIIIIIIKTGPLAIKTGPLAI